MIKIKSCDNQVELIFEIVSISEYETDFKATILNAPFNGSIEASTYHSGPPSILFDEMPKGWKGWEGEKSWSAIEGELNLSATSSNLGNISLEISMQKYWPDFKLVATIGLEAGQLEKISKEMNEYFK